MTYGKLTSQVFPEGQALFTFSKPSLGPEEKNDVTLQTYLQS